MKALAELMIIAGHCVQAKQKPFGEPRSLSRSIRVITHHFARNIWGSFLYQTF
jgi:hypothetical protein